MCGYLPGTSLCKIGVFFIEMKQEQLAGLSSLGDVVKESAVKPGMNQACIPVIVSCLRKIQRSKIFTCFGVYVT